MYGFQHIPSQQDQQVWIYRFVGNSTLQTWNKPPGISFVYITCIGAGGGGSSTFPYNAGTNAAGGSGGGSGEMTSVLLPALCVPSTLYISVGEGGAGGASSIIANTGSAGSAGTRSFVSISPTGSFNQFALCNAVGGGGAGAPIGSTIGSAGGGGSGFGITGNPHFKIGAYSQTTAAQNGQAGSTGGPISLFATNRMTVGGGGGAGTTAANAIASGSSVFVAGDYGLQGIQSLAASVNGSKFEDFIKLISAGGTGGASSTTLSGSRGGDGGIGCGGGGGGIGVGAGGGGGNGGNGLVIIMCK